jgi:hypothetical protein
MSWEQSFLAVSTLLGEPLDTAAEALEDGMTRARHGDLVSPSRPARAAAVARVVAGLLAELERASLA